MKAAVPSPILGRGGGTPAPHDMRYYVTGLRNCFFACPVLASAFVSGLFAYSVAVLLGLSPGSSARSLGEAL